MAGDAGPAPRDLPPAARVPLLVLGFAALILAILGGLARLGLNPPLPAALPMDPALAHHGPLMVAAFFGTVIGLERAVAAGRMAAYLSPLCSGVGGMLLLAGASTTLAGALMTVGAAVLAILAWTFHRRQRVPWLLPPLFGAAAACAADVGWICGLPASAMAGGWLAFLVLTIAGERQEMSRLLPPSSAAARLLPVPVLLVLAGAVLLPVQWRAGTAALGAGSLLLALWLARQDIARRNLRARGLTRYVAVSLMGGYLWLAVSGVLLPFADPGGLAYDAALHAAMLGFVFAMVFGHAPIIFPAVLRTPVPYSAVFYGHLALLHLTLAVRVAGDLAGNHEWRALGGAGNALALVLFLLATAGSVLRGRFQKSA